MTFKEIPGNEDIKSNLLRLVSKSKVPHALMLIGPEGSAVFPIALSFAQYISCTNKIDNDSCSACKSCKQAEKLIHPDIHFTFPVAKLPSHKNKEMISDSFIYDWRKFIIKNPYGTIYDWSKHLGSEAKHFNISKEESINMLKTSKLRSQKSSYKIMVVWLPEYMNIYTSNALLKLLEEPSNKTIFLLCTNDSLSIQKTLISRLQRMYIKPFTNENIYKEIIKETNLLKEDAKKISQIAMGNMSEAHKLLNNNSVNTHLKLFIDWMRLCYSCNFATVQEFSDNFVKQTKEDQKYFLKYSLKMFRTLLIYVFKIKNIVFFTEQELNFIQKISKYLNFSKIEKMSKSIEGAIDNIEKNANPKLSFLDTTIKIARIFKM